MLLQGKSCRNCHHNCEDKSPKVCSGWENVNPFITAIQGASEAMVGQMNRGAATQILVGKKVSEALKQLGI